jgi:hypothetical protein
MKTSGDKLAGVDVAGGDEKKPKKLIYDPSTGTFK